MREKEYDREKAIDYAKKWAYNRNTQYYNFDNLGGDCTSFVSQCIYAGSDVMNHDKNNGWYYNSINSRSPSWSGVEFLYDFLTANKGVGPYGKEINVEEAKVGDIAQLSFDGSKFGHSQIIVNKSSDNLDNILVATHTYDSYNRAISTYNFQKIRFIHIEGVRN